ARALISNPRILILDEATAHVDTLTEQKIQQATTKLLANRTSFVIAHRLSTICNADNIIVIGSGKILESGTHQQLLDNKGEYWQLCSSQQQAQAN
ncbi:MAG: ABC transporter ATP-binding protein, partial [Fibrobacter sp.]|nr:ABC transporter ATP-binding protein [Fibrobacter sp.]